MIATLIIIGFTIAGSVVAMIAASKAPMGYQDQNGFHFAPGQTVKAKEVSFEGTQPKYA